MKKKFRTGCPVASMLDIIGDKWSLILIRDMLLGGKMTFKEFSSSQEGIAPGILSARLKWLEENHILTKRKLPTNQKENIYLLTEVGIELTAVIAEIILWSDKNLREANPQMYSVSKIGITEDKVVFIKDIQRKYKELVNQFQVDF